MISSAQVFDTDGYSVEHLFDNEINGLLIEQFQVTENARGLEVYLRHYAISDEVEHLNRTYLVKDKFSQELAGYFSLRTGLITKRVNGNSFNSFPAIELSNFAIEANYRHNHPEVYHLGRYIFRHFVVPMVKQIAELVGVNSLYLYALPNGRLMGHYEKMGFTRLPPDQESFVQDHIKPIYDEGCIFMYQVLSLGNESLS